MEQVTQIGVTMQRMEGQEAQDYWFDNSSPNLLDYN